MKRILKNAGGWFLSLARRIDSGDVGLILLGVGCWLISPALSLIATGGILLSLAIFSPQPEVRTRAPYRATLMNVDQGEDS